MTRDDEMLRRLRLHPTSSGLDDQSLQLLALHTQVIDAEQGHVLHRAGEPVQHVLLIDSGRLRMEVVIGDSRTPVLYLAAGQHFGLLAISNEFVAPVDIVADVPSSVLSVSCTDARTLAERLPLWNRNLIRALGAAARDSLLRGKQTASKRRIAVLVHASPDTRVVTRELIRRLKAAGSSISVFSDQPAESESVLGFSASAILGDGGNCIPGNQVEQPSHDQPDSGLVLLDLMMDTANLVLGDLADHCDQVYVVVKPRDVSRAENWLAEIEPSSSIASNLRWVWCLDADVPVAPMRSGGDLAMKRELKVHLLGGEASRRLARQGVSRLLHDIRDCRVGIALGGGAARGMAHLGVLQTLEEAGITFDAIAGTSVGAMVGIVHAAGIAPEEAARSFANDLTPSRIERNMPGGEGLYLLRKYRSQGWDEMLRVYLHDWTLEQLPTPVTGVSVDLVSGRQISTSKGDAVQAILDSINLPGLSSPICRDGMALVDGGVLNVLPADVLVQHYNCDYVIAVDVGSKFSDEFVGNRQDTPTDDMNIPGIFQTVIRSMNVQTRDLRTIRSSVADLTIEPDVANVDPADFQHAVEIAAIGRRAALEMLPVLREQLRRLDPLSGLDFG